MFGCRPQLGVGVYSKMVEEIATIFDTSYEKENFSIEIPKAFNELKGEDAHHEMVPSNT